jgi:tetratricopeptide (TPR) repeat protein
MNMKSVSLAIVATFLAPMLYGQAPSNAATPAQQKIVWSLAAIKSNPDRGQPYDELALGYIRRVRETADTRYYDQAEAALQKSLQINQTPDDVLVYGLIADADLALGNYQEAEEAAQWMLDIRAGNVPGLLRGARLRQLFGDAEGAMDFYSQAYQQTPPTQTEDLAWILTRMADIQLSAGNLAGAEKLVHSALAKFPHYYLAMECQARVQMAQHKASEAVKVLRERNQNFPTAASWYALAKALEGSGQTAEADEAYAEFERIARVQIDSFENANLALIHYYLNHGRDSAEALRIARIESARRHDVDTLDAYAWALYGAGQFRDAQLEIARVFAVGLREAAFYYHAGAIAAQLNDQTSAANYFAESLKTNPSAECAEATREALGKLQTTAAISRP